MTKYTAGACSAGDGDGAVRGEQFGADAPRGLQQLFPQTVGVFAEDTVRVGVRHRPQPAVYLAPELARAPADIADKVTGLIGRSLDHVIDGVRAKGEVQVFHQ